MAVRLLNLQQLAELLGVSARHVEDLLARGVLPQPIRLGRVRRWHPEAISSWLAEEDAQANGGCVSGKQNGAGRPRSTY